MRNEKLLNPVFESLTEQARKFQTVPQFSVYEADGGELLDKDVEKYMDTILSLLVPNIENYANFMPSQKVKDEAGVKAMEALIKLENNASIQDLMQSLGTIWEDVYKKVINSKDKEKVGAIYEKVNEGIIKCLNAYAALKEKAEDKLKNKNMLEHVNSEMKGYIVRFLKSLKIAKESIQSTK